MHCCDNHDSDHDQMELSNRPPHGHRSHFWMMLLCCGAPLLLLLFLPLLGGGFSTLGAILVPFLCPVLMGVMVLLMFRKDRGSAKHSRTSESERIGD